MATPTFTVVANNSERKMLSGLVEVAKLAASEFTEAVDVTTYNKIQAMALTASFGTGNITITAQASQDGTNWVTLGSAATISGNGLAYILSGATAVQDITTVRYVRFGRGGDANVGTVDIQVMAGNSPVNLN
jgi:hypothetical protein